MDRKTCGLVGWRGIAVSVLTLGLSAALRRERRRQPESERNPAQTGWDFWHEQSGGRPRYGGRARYR